MNTRRTRTNSESSPPAVQTSPKKKARIASPTISPVPSPTSTAKRGDVAGILSPFESPDQENAADVRALKRLLESVRSGAKIPGLAPLLAQACDADLLDTEAECIEEDGDDDEDEDGNLDGFVVGDDVVEYDTEAPALPDDDDVQSAQLPADTVQPASLSDEEDLQATPRRLYRRARKAVDAEDEERDMESEIEIVPSPNKGKGRAPPPPPSPPPVPKASGSGSGGTRYTKPNIAWQDTSVEPVNCDQGLHPGSTAIDSSAAALPKLIVGDNGESVLELIESTSDTLKKYGFYVNLAPVPSGCALVLSDYKDDGWGNPPVDIVAMAETHIHLRNLLRGLLFRVQGPYVNAAQVNTDDLIAVMVSPPNSTQRYKVIKADTRAPAIFITGGIARYWRLDTPTTGSHPIKYLSMTQFESNFDRSVAVDCTVFGQKELNCVSFNNAIRYSTLPVFDRPAATPNAKVKPSSSIRRSGTSQSTRRAPNFEMSTNDVVPVYDARKVALPADISTWQSTLPVFEGPLPKNAVVFVAHTTNMWVGTRSTTSASAITHNVQYNLVFVVIVGVLPLGYV
ncbi:hypothetical protein K525DRAFT_274847 [Schizophyllum commune Loenen D]|nr:hypothetical protein K525DRAFT_274847 [Schizophyllum commune Loenen D]